jgi:hypothetical protein
MPTQYGNLAATHACIAEYAASTSSPDLSSYCPRQCSMLAKLTAARGPLACEVQKPERFAFRLCVFILPPDYFACGKLQKKVAAARFEDSFRDMIEEDKIGSKLCARDTRAATAFRLSAGSVAQLGKEGDTPSVASFPRPPVAAGTETRTVSEPSGLATPVVVGRRA